jgi:hypothetical protein
MSDEGPLTRAVVLLSEHAGGKAPLAKHRESSLF